MNSVNLLVDNCERHPIVNGEYAEDGNVGSRLIYKNTSADIYLFYNQKLKHWAFSDDMYDAKSYLYHVSSNCENPIGKYLTVIIY